mmetsp:Transcript_14407/g.19745  ORF Transcript_14407/g.19745 Transcript_14407/m.19745 type:complete len:1493 (+) Transcript_14407:1968-6446(+)
MASRHPTHRHGSYLKYPHSNGKSINNSDVQNILSESYNVGKYPSSLSNVAFAPATSIGQILDSYHLKGNQTSISTDRVDQNPIPALNSNSKSLSSYLSRLSSPHSDPNNDSSRESESVTDTPNPSKKYIVAVENDRKPLFYHEVVHNYYSKPSENNAVDTKPASIDVEVRSEAIKEAAIALHTKEQLLADIAVTNASINRLVLSDLLDTSINYEHRRQASFDHMDTPLEFQQNETFSLENDNASINSLHHTPRRRRRSSAPATTGVGQYLRSLFGSFTGSTTKRSKDSKRRRYPSRHKSRTKASQLSNSSSRIASNNGGYSWDTSSFDGDDDDSIVSGRRMDLNEGRRRKERRQNTNQPKHFLTMHKSSSHKKNRRGEGFQCSNGERATDERGRLFSSSSQKQHFKNKDNFWHTNMKIFEALDSSSEIERNERDISGAMEAPLSSMTKRTFTSNRLAGLKDNDHYNKMAFRKRSRFPDTNSSLFSRGKDLAKRKRYDSSQSNNYEKMYGERTSLDESYIDNESSGESSQHRSLPSNKVGQSTQTSGKRKLANEMLISRNSVEDDRTYSDNDSDGSNVDNDRSMWQSFRKYLQDKTESLQSAINRMKRQHKKRLRRKRRESEKREQEVIKRRRNSRRRRPQNNYSIRGRKNERRLKLITLESDKSRESNRKGRLMLSKPSPDDIHVNSWYGDDYRSKPVQPPSHSRTPLLRTNSKSANIMKGISTRRNRTFERHKRNLNSTQSSMTHTSETFLSSPSTEIRRKTKGQRVPFHRSRDLKDSSDSSLSYEDDDSTNDSVFNSKRSYKKNKKNSMTSLLMSPINSTKSFFSHMKKSMQTGQRKEQSIYKSRNSFKNNFHGSPSIRFPRTMQRNWRQTHESSKYNEIHRGERQVFYRNYYEMDSDDESDSLESPVESRGGAMWRSMRSYVAATSRSMKNAVARINHQRRKRRDKRKRNVAEELAERHRLKRRAVKESSERRQLSLRKMAANHEENKNRAIKLPRLQKSGGFLKPKSASRTQYINNKLKSSLNYASSDSQERESQRISMGRHHSGEITPRRVDRRIKQTSLEGDEVDLQPNSSAFLWSKLQDGVIQAHTSMQQLVRPVMGDVPSTSREQRLERGLQAKNSNGNSKQHERLLSNIIRNKSAEKKLNTSNLYNSNRANSNQSTSKQSTYSHSKRNMEHKSDSDKSQNVYLNSNFKSSSKLQEAKKEFSSGTFFESASTEIDSNVAQSQDAEPSRAEVVMINDIVFDESFENNPTTRTTPNRNVSISRLPSVSNGNTSIEESDHDIQIRPSDGSSINHHPAVIIPEHNHRSNSTRGYFNSFPHWYTSKHAKEAQERDEKAELLKSHGIDIGSPNRQEISPNGIHQFNQQENTPKKNTNSVSSLAKAGDLFKKRTPLPAEIDDISYDIYSNLKKERAGEYHLSPLRAHLQNQSKKNSPSSHKISSASAAVYPKYTTIYGEKYSAVGMNERDQSILQNYRLRRESRDVDVVNI